MSAKSLAAYLVLSTAFIFAVFASAALAQGTLYEGARLITGDGSTIEDSSFFVEGNQFTRIGRKGEVALPDGSVRIDLTGKTVMPALIDKGKTGGVLAARAVGRAAIVLQFEAGLGG